MFSLTRYLPLNMQQNIRHPKNATKLLIQNLFTNFAQKFLGSYSQHGEDIIINHLLKKTKKGFYVDIGANHPIHINNTYFFYKAGWNGINIEPHPILYKKICSERGKDINLNIGVSREKGELTFYQINEVDGTAGSTFDKDVAVELEQKGYKIAEKITMPVAPLKDILDEYIIENKKIDFMSIDTEGFDKLVLESNDWQKYRPNLVMVETVSNKNAIINYMIEQGYKIVYENTANTMFMIKG